MKANFSTKISSLLKLRVVPVAMALVLGVTTVTAVVQPAPTAQAGFVSDLKCAFLKSYADSSRRSLKQNQNNMEFAFELQLTALKTNWQLQDAAVTAYRGIVESTFKANVNAFANRPGIFIKNTEYRDKATQDYKTTILDALHTLETNIDTIRANYRENMLALVLAHQDALRDLVNELISTIDVALEKAVTKCADKGSAKALFDTINAANWKLLSAGVAQEVSNNKAAAKLVHERDAGFIREKGIYDAASIKATTELIAAFVTRQ